MAISNIIASITSKIAAVTAATPADELALLKVIGTKLGLNTSNVVSSANTASNSATGSSDLTDLVLWNQAIGEYGGKSYVGEQRTFSDLMPINFVTEDGASWLKQGFFETDVNKVKKEAFPYACVGNNEVTNLGVSSFTSPANTITGEIVVLNSGKFISFPFGSGSAASITSFTNPETAGTQLAASIIPATDYSYDESTDTLYILAADYILYKITADGTVITSIAQTTYNVTSSHAVLAFNGIVYVGGANSLKKSTNDGVTWNTVNVTALPASHNILRLAYDTSLNKMFMFCSASTGFARTNTTTLSIFTSVNEAAPVSIGSNSWDGFMYPIINVNNDLFFLNDASNGTNATHNIRCIKQGTTTVSNFKTVTATSVPDSRSKFIYSKQKQYFIFMYRLSTATKLEIFYTLPQSFSIAAEASIVDFVCSDNAVGLSRISFLLYNEAIYMKRQATSTLTFKKLPTYGIVASNTPKSYLRIL